MIGFIDLQQTKQQTGGAIHQQVKYEVQHGILNFLLLSSHKIRFMEKN